MKKALLCLESQRLLDSHTHLPEGGTAVAGRGPGLRGEDHWRCFLIPSTGLALSTQGGLLDHFHLSGGQASPGRPPVGWKELRSSRDGCTLKLLRRRQRVGIKSGCH